METPSCWKDVPGYEGVYKVNADGEIYSLLKDRKLKPHVSKNGYAYVFLVNTQTREKKYCPMHRIIASVFVPGYRDGLCVNHKNEIKIDNRASNLEWCTKAYNNTYNGKAQRCCKPVAQYSLDGKFIRRWTSAREVSKTTGIQYKNISAVCRGKRNNAGGYLWTFEGDE